MTAHSGISPVRVTTGTVLISALCDIVFVLLFAASGRSQHGEAATLLGLWHTAWPFLVGLASMWIVARAWRNPRALLRCGLPVWIGTLSIGLLLRVLFTDGGAALPFVLVAAGVLGTTLIGWRLVVLLVLRWRRRS